jgi:hypothetical protein
MNVCYAHLPVYCVLMYVPNLTYKQTATSSVANEEENYLLFAARQDQTDQREPKALISSPTLSLTLHLISPPLLLASLLSSLFQYRHL